jgi:hypothetical protein
VVVAGDPCREHEEKLRLIALRQKEEEEEQRKLLVMSPCPCPETSDTGYRKHSPLQDCSRLGTWVLSR